MLAAVSAAIGLVVASLSASWLGAFDLGRRSGRSPAGCYELDHCGLSWWWTLGFLLVVWGLPAVAFSVAGWSGAARMSWSARARATLLFSLGVVAYHLACGSLFVLIADR
ncbi:hypothetical protein [Anaeromyxobacter dehalogenans]|uniref:hypothetical protein n=1 Tax=Anaeromyxobacter dehalogenans TaxID=161493 RepID=UPI00059E5E46|nr:hypothetical protein [Anaeromyxobacter dehalogenans]